jgi:hypothetical protein
MLALVARFQNTKAHLETEAAAAGPAAALAPPVFLELVDRRVHGCDLLGLRQGAALQLGLRQRRGNAQRVH